VRARLPLRARGCRRGAGAGARRLFEGGLAPEVEEIVRAMEPQGMRALSSRTLRRHKDLEQRAARRSEAGPSDGEGKPEKEAAGASVDAGTGAGAGAPAAAPRRQMVLVSATMPLRLSDFASRQLPGHELVRLDVDTVGPSCAQRRGLFLHPRARSSETRGS